MKLAKNVDLKEIAKKTPGFTGNDIELLCVAVGVRITDNIKAASVFGKELDRKSFVAKKKYFDKELKTRKPIGVNDLVIRQTGVGFSDICGLQEEKDFFKDEIEIRSSGKKSKLHERAGLQPLIGVLMVGRPGSSKTFFAKALATESGRNFINIKSSKTHSKWFSESEGTLESGFATAKTYSPSLVFIDEFDVMFRLRGSIAGGPGVNERMVGALNVELDGVEGLGDVFVLAATNRLDLIDPASIRRFHIMFMSELDKGARIACFEKYSADMSLDKGVDFEKLAELTGKRRFVLVYDDKEFSMRVPFNGGEIKDVCAEASRIALKEFREKWGDVAKEKADEFFVHQRHFEEVLLGRKHEEQKTGDETKKEEEFAPEKIDKAVDDFKLKLNKEDLGITNFDVDKKKDKKGKKKNDNK